MSRQHAYGRKYDSQILRGTSADHLDVLVGAFVPLPKLERSEMLLVCEQGVKEELQRASSFPLFSAAAPRPPPSPRELGKPPPIAAGYPRRGQHS